MKKIRRFHAEIKELSQVRPWRSLIHILIEWLAIMTIAWVSEQMHNIFFYFLASILIGARFHALAVLGHDGNHNLLFSQPWLNRIVVMNLLLWPNAASASEFKAEHLLHHKYLSTDRDPDFYRISKYPEFQFPMSRMNFFSILLRDALGLNFFKYFSKSRQFRVLRLQPSSRKRSFKIFYAIASYFLILLVAYSFGYLRIAILYWLIPYMTWNQLIFRVRTIAEHSVVKQNRSYGTNTVIAGPIEELIFGLKNANYHIEHHLYPSVPWFNLGKLHGLLMSSKEHRDSISVYPSYLAVLRQCVRRSEIT